jgi:toxin ParE1/3/4
LPENESVQKPGIYNLTEAAEQDVREIWEYVAEYDLAFADKMIDLVFDKFQLLADHKEIGRRLDYFIIEMRMLPFKKYQIFYFPNDDGVEIYRVLHGARDVEGEFEDYFEGLKA